MVQNNVKKGIRPHTLKLGKFDLKEEVGRGSMGVVYRGYDSFINREVALKVSLLDIRQDGKHQMKYRRLFFNEARIAGMLDHANIIHVYDAGVEAEKYFIVMEYVKGARNLKESCKPDNLLPVETVVEIIFKCCRALDYAHEMGIIHRDIKPGNIMLTEDMDVKIADFSIAQLVRTDSTQLGGLVGSPLYMSPEQVKEEELSTQTDLYSLGVVMYELLTGRAPFDSENVSGLIYKIINEEPLPVRLHNPEIPENLERIVLKAMKKDLSERYPRGIDFAADLSDAFNDLKQEYKGVDDVDKMNALKQIDFFKEFFDSELWEILSFATWVNFSPGERIITEGEIDDCFYIIVSGEVNVKKDDKHIITLTDGDCFGEMGYLAKTKRTATIISCTDVTLLKVSGTLIDKSSLQCQLRFNKVFLKTLILRLSKTSEELVRGKAKPGVVPSKSRGLNIEQRIFTKCTPDDDNDDNNDDNNK